MIVCTIVGPSSEVKLIETAYSFISYILIDNVNSCIDNVNVHGIHFKYLASSRYPGLNKTGQNS